MVFTESEVYASPAGPGEADMVFTESEVYASPAGPGEADMVFTPSELYGAPDTNSGQESALGEDVALQGERRGISEQDATSGTGQSADEQAGHGDRNHTSNPASLPEKVDGLPLTAQGLPDSVGATASVNWALGDQGGITGVNLQYTPTDGVGVYVISPNGAEGLSAGAGVDVNAAWGHGSWESPPTTESFSVGPVSAFTASGPDTAWDGFSAGAGVGEGVIHAQTNVTAIWTSGPVSEITKGMASTGTDTVQNGIQGANAAVSEMAAAVSEYAHTIGTAVENGADAATDIVSDAAHSVAATVESGAQEIAATVSDGASNIANAVETGAQAVSSLADSAATTTQGAIEQIEDWFD
jgi:hypothetical protein